MLSKTNARFRQYLAVRKETQENKRSKVILGNEHIFDRLIDSASFSRLQVATHPQLKKIDIPTTPAAKIDNNKGLASPSTTTTSRSSSSSMCSCCHALTSHSSSLSGPDSGFSLSPRISDSEVLCPKDADKRVIDSVQTWSSIFSDVAAIYDTAETSPKTQISLPKLPPVDIGCIVDIFEALQLKPMESPSIPENGHRTMLSTSGSHSSNNSLPSSESGRERLSLVTSQDDSDRWFPVDEEPQTSSPQTPIQRSPRNGSGHSVLSSKKRHSVRKRQSGRNQSSPTSPQSTSKSPSPRLSTSTKRSSSSRWKLAQVTGNMADMFRFAHTDADEMLTPERVLQKKVQLETEKARAKVIALNKVANRDSVISTASASSSSGGEVAVVFQKSEDCHDPKRVASHVSEQRTIIRRPFSFELSDILSVEGIAAASKRDPQHEPQTDPPVPRAASSEETSPPILTVPSTINPIARVRSSAPRRGSSSLATIDEVSPLTPTSDTSSRLSTRNPNTSRINKSIRARISGSAVSPLTPSPKKNRRSVYLPFGEDVRTLTDVGESHNTSTSSNTIDGTAHTKALIRIRADKNAISSRALTKEAFSGRSDELLSTPYSLTSPYFRHGQIRLSWEQQSATDDTSNANEIYSSTSGLKHFLQSPPDHHSSKAQAMILSKHVYNDSFSVQAKERSHSPQVDITEFHENDEIDLSELCDWWTDMNVSYGTMINATLAMTCHTTNDLDQSPPPTNFTSYIQSTDTGSRWKENGHYRSFSQTIPYEQDLNVNKNLDFFSDSEISITDSEYDQDTAAPLDPSHRQHPPEIDVESGNKWYRKSGMPSALRIGYHPTPVRDAFERRQLRISAGTTRYAQDIATTAIERDPRPDSTILDETGKENDDENAAIHRDDSSYDSAPEPYTETYAEAEATVANGVLSGTRRSSKDSALSGPDSPMIDYSANINGEQEEVIPMGFNLTHDIGDFLRWEMSYAETSYAEDFQ